MYKNVTINGKVLTNRYILPNNSEVCENCGELKNTKFINDGDYCCICNKKFIPSFINHKSKTLIKKKENRIIYPL
ncbi:MAG: hypothetical protein Q4E69_00910 [Bacilli bacterium]|nr:hypothetical protein [Bacilli bacterium]